MSSIVHSHGGDIVNFTGSSMLVVWPFDSDEPHGAEAAECSVSASRCALELLRWNGLELFPHFSQSLPEPAGASSEDAGRTSWERERRRRLRRVREITPDVHGVQTELQGCLVLLPAGLEDNVLDQLQPNNPRGREEPILRARSLHMTAGVGVGELFCSNVGMSPRWEYVVWGEPLADIVRAVQVRARPPHSSTARGAHRAT